MGTRVLVVCPRRAHGEALAQAISRWPGVTAWARTTTTDDPEGTGGPPQVALIDVTGGGFDGGEAASKLRDAAPEVRVLLLGDGEDVAFARHALAAGAHGVVSASEPMVEVIDAIRRAAIGEPPTMEPADSVSPHDRRRRAPHATERQRAERLTAREREILQLMVDGLEPAEIAVSLRITPATLRTHVQNVLTKLGVHSKTQAVLLAIRQGAVATPG